MNDNEIDEREYKTMKIIRVIDEDERKAIMSLVDRSEDIIVIVDSRRAKITAVKYIKIWSAWVGVVVSAVLVIMTYFRDAAIALLNVGVP